MNASVLKYAPTSVLLAAAGAYAWPYLGESAPQAPPAAASKAGGPSVPDALLKPARIPRPLRDPFQDPEVFRKEARARIALALKSLVERAKPAPGKVATGPGHGRPGSDPAAEVDPREGMVLSATTAQGARGLAVINGRVYLTGEAVRDALTPDPCVLAEVRVNQAILRHRGKTYPLDYPAAPGRGAAGPPTTDPRTDSTASVPASRGAPAAGRVPARRVGTKKRTTPR